MIVGTISNMNNSDLVQYLEKHIGDRIFLNANDQNPYVLESVEKDYIKLSQVQNSENSSLESCVVPITAIVSVQELKGIQGIILYLIK